MNYSLASTVLSALLLATSCEKHKALLGESERVETELNNRTQELHSLDAKFAAWGSDPAALAQQRATLLQNNAALQQELTTLSTQYEVVEQTLKETRSKVDAYTAKFAR